MEYTVKPTEFYNNLLSHNNQRLNSSNVVFDIGGDQLNRANTSNIQNYNSQISGLRLFTMVAPFTVIFVLAVTGMLNYKKKKIIF